MSHAPKSRQRVFEKWEMALAKEIAQQFRTDPDEIEGVLLMRLAELKTRDDLKPKDWKSFLAKSFYNAARDYLRKHQIRHRNVLPLDAAPSEAERVGPSLEEILAMKEKPIDLQIDVAQVLSGLTPDLQRLAALLVEEDGNVSSVAKRLGRPRKTVDYWIQKLKGILKKSGLD